MILISLIELFFVIVIMRFIESIGFGRCCLIYGVFSALGSLLNGFGILSICSAFIGGLISGAVAYIMAKIFLFLIDLLGSLAYFLIVALFILVLIAIIL